MKKIGKVDFIKIRNFCFVKGTVKRMKRKVIEQENIHTNHLSDKGLVSVIYTELKIQQ